MRLGSSKLDRFVDSVRVPSAEVSELFQLAGNIPPCSPASHSYAA